MLPGNTPALFAAASRGNDANTMLLHHFNTTPGLLTDSAKGHPGRVYAAGGTSPFLQAGGVFGERGGFSANGYLYTAGTPDLDFTGDYTIDVWAQPTITQTAGFLGMYYGAGVAYSPWMFYQGGGYNFYFYASSNGTSWDIANGIGIGTLGASVFGHLAVVRQGNVYKTYCNGVFGTTVTSSLTPWPVGALSGSNVIIGYQNAAPSYWGGYLDELRISKVARWSAPFTPPTAPYT
jgi:hypothetical protein